MSDDFVRHMSRKTLCQTFPFCPLVWLIMSHAYEVIFQWALCYEKGPRSLVGILWAAIDILCVILGNSILGQFNFCENNTGCQWQPMLFPPTGICKSCAPYNYQDHLSIQNVKVLSWALKIQSPKFNMTLAPRVDDYIWYSSICKVLCKLLCQSFRAARH